MNLHGAISRAFRHFRRVEFSGRGFGRRVHPLIVQPGRAQYHQLGCVDLGFHLGQLKTYLFKSGDLRAERFARSRVGERLV
jgi:hypothetical protein